MAIVGIDLGTTYSAVARVVDGKPEIIELDGSPTMPSVVSVQKSGKIAIGRVAKRNQAKNPQDTVVEVKRLMGEARQVRLGQKEFSPQELSAMILKKLGELAEAELGEEVEGAVITCPAYFKDPQRAATREAGEISGLNVLRIVNEPTAAAYAYGLDQGDPDKENLFLVYDLGGGTFDVTVIKMVGGNLEVIGTGGDPQLGGGNFDDAIVDWMLSCLEETIPEFVKGLDDGKASILKMKLKSYAEEAKIKLCGPPECESFEFQVPQLARHEGKPVSFRETLTMAKFEELIGELMANSLKWVDEAMKVPKEKHNYTEEHLTDILLVGGSTRVPLVRRLLAERFPNTRVRGMESGVFPDEIVAKGASIIASQVDPESDEVVETVLVDVTGHTLGVAVMDEEKGREILAPLIPKETPLPTTASHQFSTMGEFQTQARVRVFQGEGIEIDPEKVSEIGDFLIHLDPIKDPTPIIIGLDLNEDGLLVAHATNGLTGQQVRCEIKYEDVGRISPEDLKKKRDALDAQLGASVGVTENPLEDAPGGGAPAAPAAAPSQAAATSPATMAAPAGAAPAPPAPAAPAAAQGGDPSALMNPIMRSLYKKAIDNFAKIPADKQSSTWELVSKIEASARAGDQAQLMSYFQPLSQLLDGI